METLLRIGLSNAVVAWASEANRGGSSQPLEQVLLDLMSLGQRLNWGQLEVFVSRLEDAETLDRLANVLRKNEGQVPALFAAVALSGQPSEVARYLMNFSQTGLADLAATFRFGSGGANELLRRNQRFYTSNLRQRVTQYDPFGAVFDFALDYCLRQPWLGLTLKWVLYLGGGFCAAAALA